MSRLDFGPDTNAIEVIDIETGHMVFGAVPGTPVSLRELTLAIHAAGYEIAEASLTARGALRNDLSLWVSASEQRLTLQGTEERLQSLRDVPAGTLVAVSGRWSHDGDTQVITVASFAIVDRP